MRVRQPGTVSEKGRGIGRQGAAMKRHLTPEIQQELEKRLERIEQGHVPDPMHIREWWLPLVITAAIILFLYLVAAGH